LLLTGEAWFVETANHAALANDHSQLGLPIFCNHSGELFTTLKFSLTL